MSHSGDGGREHEGVRRILADIPMNESSVFIVHSSFRLLSAAGYRAEAFCEALLDAVAPGTLLMPTMTWRTVTPDSPYFDEIATPSHTGVLTEVFRTRYAQARSLHATHSVAGAGPLSRLLLSCHHEGDTPCAGNSPYGLMREYDAYVLLLGVDFERCTAIHHAEEVMAPDIYVEPKEGAVSYRLAGRDGCSFNVLTRRHRRLSRDFSQFERSMGDAVRCGDLDGTPWRLFSLCDLYRTVFARFVETRHATLKTEC